MVLSFSVSDAIKYHVYFSVFFCFSVPLTILFVAVLSVATGFGSCWWNISSRAVLMDVAFWQFSNNHPNYDFVDDAMTFLIMLHSTCTGPFYRCVDCIGMLDFGPRKKYPPALIRASGSDM